MGQSNGFILLSRSLLDSEVFASQKMLKIWVWCLLKANYKDKFVPIKVGKGETTVEVKRGSFLFGRFKAEEEIDIDGSTIYRILRKLESLGNIEIKASNQYSVVSICNYDSYQNVTNYKKTADELDMNQIRTRYELDMNTTNKEKNNKKDKKEKKKDIVNLWNTFAEKNNLAKIKGITKSRSKHLDARLEEDNFEFNAILQQIEKQDFLLGKGGMNWKVNFDFIIKNDNNFIKILEGGYASKKDYKDDPTIEAYDRL
jgi:hypothetical protein